MVRISASLNRRTSANIVFQPTGNGQVSYQQPRHRAMSIYMPSTTSSLKPSMLSYLDNYKCIRCWLIDCIFSPGCTDCSKLLFTLATWHFLALVQVSCVVPWVTQAPVSLSVKFILPSKSIKLFQAKEAFFVRMDRPPEGLYIPKAQFAFRLLFALLSS